jgi:hypothetical protein
VHLPILIYYSYFADSRHRRSISADVVGKTATGSSLRCPSLMEMKRADSAAAVSHCGITNVRRHGHGPWSCLSGER